MSNGPWMTRHSGLVWRRSSQPCSRPCGFPQSGITMIDHYVASGFNIVHPLWVATTDAIQSTKDMYSGWIQFSSLSPLEIVLQSVAYVTRDTNG